MLGNLLRSRPKVTLLIALLAISIGFTLLPAREALADYTFRIWADCCGRTFNVDSDQYVPESSGSPAGSHYDRILGQTYFYSDTAAANGGYWQAYIKYDWVEMRRCNATDAQNSALIGHERAHSRGWGHGEGPASLNKAYNPKIPGVICPRT